MTERDPLSGLTPTRAPSGLREPVLRAAREALAQGAPATTAWELLWRNRTLRLGWAVACVALLVGHLALTFWPQRSPAAGHLAETPSRERSPELRDVLDLPPTEPLAALIGDRFPAASGSVELAPVAGAARKG